MNIDMYFFLNVENCKISIDMNIKVANAWCSKLSLRLLFIIGRYSHNGLKLVKKSILTNFYPQWAVYVCMYVCMFINCNITNTKGSSDR